MVSDLRVLLSGERINNFNTYILFCNKAMYKIEWQNKNLVIIPWNCSQDLNMYFLMRI